MEARQSVPEFHYNPDRLTFPLKRVRKRGEGKWERITRIRQWMRSLRNC